MNDLVSWIHFGDLHISEREDAHYGDFLTLIHEANRNMADIDFAVLPGDNADNGEEDQYRCVQEALKRVRFPVHAITGDHDVAGGGLELFKKYLELEPYRSFSRGVYHFVFLNSVAVWNPPVFGLGKEQMRWLRSELTAAVSRGLKSVVFMHSYPTEHGAEADSLRCLFGQNNVLIVEMGHTHYNELANDGRTIYAATRSTGQVEEGPPGFSVTTLDGGVVSWKFKSIRQWPLVMITSPADHRLVADWAGPRQVVRGKVRVRARIWGPSVEQVTLSINGGDPQAMSMQAGTLWEADWHSNNGRHTVEVTARCDDGRTASDRIVVMANQAGHYATPKRNAIDYENAVGAWPEKHILGTQLGPNENGRHWPSKRNKEHSAK